MFSTQITEKTIALSPKRQAEVWLPDLSFVIPAFNEEKNIPIIIEQVANEAKRLVKSYEIIIVDDGSSDDTLKSAHDMSHKYSVGIIRLSRNFGKEQAIMAGLERAAGKAVVILDADLQEPISYLEEMLNHYHSGYEMVYAIRSNRQDESYLKRVFTKIFYRFLSFGSNIHIPENARDFRILDRRVVDALCSLDEKNRFMKGLYGWVGFKTKAIPIDIKRRQNGHSKFGFHGLFKLGLTGVTSFTDLPLRVWTAVGLVFALISFLFAIWITAKTLIFGVDTPGWATITVAIFFLGGLQLISIGVLGEYLARVFTEVKCRPGYIVAEEIYPERRQQ